MSLQTTRVIECHHVRTFSEAQLMKLLSEAVMREAGHSGDNVVGTSIRIVYPETFGPITVKVDVKEVTP